jgi:iron-sulfur cluster repair protein YtfE (RIC family)
MSSLSTTVGEFDTITAYLTWEHRRLGRLLDDVAGFAREGDWTPARAAYGEFECGVERHMRDEEEVLFPLFEARSGIVDGPTGVLRAEHRQVRGSLVRMHDAVTGGDAPGFEEGRSFLHSVLPAHDAQEEHVLFPTIDRLLAPAERRAVVARLLRR